jgi:type II secretory pathway pseudopilin PulG
MSLVEALVAVAILAVSMAGLLTLNSQETRGVAFTERRFYALMALAELRESLAGKPRYFYVDSSFPADAGSFSALQTTLIEDHPLLLPVLPGEENPVNQSLQARFADLQLQRFVLYQPTTLPDGTEVGLVTFLVRYQNAKGALREVSTVQVVF